MKKLTILTAVSMALVTPCAFSQGTVVFDQESFTGSPSFDQLTSITSGQPMGQSFTPSLAAVGFINFVMSGGLDLKPGTAYIVIHSGSITGPVLGTSEAVNVAPPISPGIITFNFDTPVVVTPGTMYYFQPIIEPGGGNLTTPSIFPSIYSGGTAFYNGNAVANVDFEFQEGVYVPEPSTWALLVLGAGALWSVRRKT